MGVVQGIKNVYRGYQISIEEFKRVGFKGFLEAAYKDMFVGRSLLSWVYLIALASAPIWIELIGGGITTDWLGMTAAITGVLCVLLVAEGRYSNYFFGLINSAIYLYLCLTAEGGAFYGEVFTTLYFLVCQPIGFFTWIRVKRDKVENTKQTEGTVKSLTLFGWVKMIGLTVLTWVLMGFAYKSIGSNRPFRDSVTDGTNVTGQLLMNEYYWEQWIFWIATNLFSIYLWWGASLQMQGMYWIYTLNSLVGWYTWYKNSKKK